jgi:hypothetical protein
MVSAIRNFTSQLENSIGRSIGDDAPIELRQEFIDLAFHLFDPSKERDEVELYSIITQSLGITPSGQPYGGFRYAASKAINTVEWPRVYDLISRLWVEVPFSLRGDYRIGVNRILAAYRIAWDLGEDGHLHRVLPPAARRQIEVVFQDLSEPHFAAAATSFLEGLNAYEDRPQRGRDACKNIFDALESVAKEIFSMPNATFGEVLTAARKQQSMASETISVLQKLYDLANAHFRHGRTTPLTLKPSEVDFVFFVVCGRHSLVRAPMSGAEISEAEAAGLTSPFFHEAVQERPRTPINMLFFDHFQPFVKQHVVGLVDHEIVALPAGRARNQPVQPEKGECRADVLSVSVITFAISRHVHAEPFEADTRKA